MVKGLIINKFRGDKTILDPGIVMLEEKGNIPVVGITPYLSVQLDDEDSLTERFCTRKEAGKIDLAVIRFPRISNFTDFNALEVAEDVSVRYVTHEKELLEPDMIILPGSKNTMEDLRWLRQSGMEAAILKLHARGTVIFGICGGYQMLGEMISDPEQMEAGGRIRGMGLLPVDTVFSTEKTRTRVEGRFRISGGTFAKLSGLPFYGYEVHMGQTISRGEMLAELTETSRQKDCIESGKQTKADGCWHENVYGTYVHGIFDREGVVPAILEALAEQKGITLSGLGQMDFAAWKEMQYDLLADGLREHLDMDKIYQILEEGV